MKHHKLCLRHTQQSQGLQWRGGTHTHRSGHLTSGNTQLHCSYPEVRHVFLQTEISKCYKRRRGRELENKGIGVKKEVCGLSSESLSIQGSSVDQIHGRLMSINITGPWSMAEHRCPPMLVGGTELALPRTGTFWCGSQQRGAGRVTWSGPRGHRGRFQPVHHLLLPGAPALLSLPGWCSAVNCNWWTGFQPPPRRAQNH